MLLEMVLKGSPMQSLNPHLHRKNSGVKIFPKNEFWSLENWRGKLLDLFVLGILIFPVLNAFFPPDAYFHPIDSLYFTTPELSNTSKPLIGRITFLFLAGFLAYQFWRRPKSLSKASILAFPFLLLCAYIILSSFWSYNVVAGITKSYRQLLLLFFTIYTFEKYGSNKTIQFVFYAIFISALLSVLTVIIFPKFGLETLNGMSGLWRGAFIQKNMLGENMTYGIIISIFCAITSKNAKASFFFWLAVGLCAILLIKSGSATAMISCFGALVAGSLLLISRNFSAKVRMSFYVILMLCTVTYLYVFMNTDFIFQITGKSGDFTGRSIIWENVQTAIKEKPIFGHGIGFWISENSTRDSIWSRVGYRVPHSHNTYLDLTLQLGLVGLALYALLCLTIIWLSFSTIARNESALPIMYLSIFVVILIRSVTETTLGASDNSAFWYALPLVGLLRHQFAPSNRLKYKGNAKYHMSGINRRRD